MRWLEYIAFFVEVLGLARPVGAYLAHVCEREHTFADRVFCPIESMLYRVLGVDATLEMSARVYIFCVVAFDSCTACARQYSVQEPNAG